MKYWICVVMILCMVSGTVYAEDNSNRDIGTLYVGNGQTVELQSEDKATFTLSPAFSRNGKSVPIYGQKPIICKDTKNCSVMHSGIYKVEIKPGVKFHLVIHYKKKVKHEAQKRVSPQD